MPYTFIPFRALARGLVLGLALGLAAPVASPARDIPGSFADLAERLSPAVVNISTSQTVDRPQAPNIPEGPFEDLFRDFFERGGPQGPREVESLGSGFVVSGDGFVVTNSHVIKGADAVTVNFPDGRSLEAEVVGTDPKTDLALLKVEPDAPLEFVQFGDSAGSRVGDWVLAIGNPFGLGGSVSAGIISARNRNINAGPYDDFIQTDAAINRGNSGGPLFNLEGKVIGVNTAIISPTGGSIGIGFAVPSALAKPVVAQLREYGETRRGWLGVRVQEVTGEIADALGLEEPRGALVSSLTEGGPAAEAGIRSGDVILRFDGREVPEMRDLPRMVAETSVGKTVRVVVSRDGETRTVKVKLGRLEDFQAASAGSGDGSPSQSQAPTEMGALGFSLAPLDETLRQRFDIAENVSGVVVTDVTVGGPAASKGIEAGDVVVEVGQEPVSSPEEVGEQVAAALDQGRSSILVLVQSGSDLRFVPLPIGG